MSEYDNIKTAEAVIKRLQQYPHSLLDRCKFSDIFEQLTKEDKLKLAINPETQKVFCGILIDKLDWNNNVVEEATETLLAEKDKCIAELAAENEKLKAKCKERGRMIDTIREKVEALGSELCMAHEETRIAKETGVEVTPFMLEEKDKEIANLRESLLYTVQSADRLDDELCEARKEITRLKAKIYDMEHPEEGSDNDG